MKFWTNGYWCDTIKEAEEKACAKYNIWQIPEGEKDPSKGKLIVRWRTMR